MPVEADALDHVALGVAQSLARSGRTAPRAELDEHRRALVEALASVRALFVAADTARPDWARRSARDRAVRDLIEGLGRAGRLAAVVRELASGGDDPEAGTGSPAAQLRVLCRLPTEADPVVEATLESLVLEQVASGSLAAELRWLLASGLIGRHDLAGILRPLGRQSARRLAGRIRRGDGRRPDEGYPFVPSVPSATSPNGTSGLPAIPRVGGVPGGISARVASEVDGTVRTVARSVPVLAAHRALRASRRRLDQSAWAEAVRSFDGGTAVMASLVAEALGAPAAGREGSRAQPEGDRLLALAERQERLLASLSGLRQDYLQAVDEHRSAEASWRQTFRLRLLEAAVAADWGSAALRHLAASYPSLSLSEVEVAAGSLSDGPPPSTDLADGSELVSLLVAEPPQPAAVVTVPTPRPAPPTEAPPVAPAPRPRPARPPLSPAARLRAGLAAAGALSGLAVGWLLGGPGHQDAQLPLAPRTPVITASPPAALPGNHVSLHLAAVAAKDGSLIGPLEELDGISAVDCASSPSRLIATTTAGQTYQLAVSPAGTQLSFGDRAGLGGPALPQTTGGQIEGSTLLSPPGSVPAGAVSVRASCPGAAPAPLTMAVPIPPALDIGTGAPHNRVSVSPGPAGMIVGALILLVGLLLAARGLEPVPLPALEAIPRLPEPAGVRVIPVVLLLGAGILAFSGHRAMAAGDPAPTLPAQIRSPGCEACPDGIRITSTEVQARPDSQLLIFRGAWSGFTADDPAISLQLSAGDTTVVVRPHRDPAGLLVVSASRAGQPLAPGSVAIGVRRDVLLIAVRRAELPAPLGLELDVLQAGVPAGRVPAAGQVLAWRGAGAPNPVAGGPAAAPPAPSASAAATPAVGPRPGPVASDLTALAGACAAVPAGRLPDTLTPVSVFTGTVPDVSSSSPTRYLSVYMARGAFGSGIEAKLQGQPPFDVVLAIQRSPSPGSGPRAIDRIGDLQLWASWDGQSLHRAVRSFAGGSWTLRQDAAAGDLSSVDVRNAGLVFYWSGARGGDRLAGIVSDGHACSAIGLSPQGQPSAPGP